MRVVQQMRIATRRAGDVKVGAKAVQRLQIAVMARSAMQQRRGVARVEASMNVPISSGPVRRVAACHLRSAFFQKIARTKFAMWRRAPALMAVVAIQTVRVVRCVTHLKFVRNQAVQTPPLMKTVLKAMCA